MSTWPISTGISAVIAEVASVDGSGPMSARPGVVNELAPIKPSRMASW